MELDLWIKLLIIKQHVDALVKNDKYHEHYKFLVSL